MSQSIQDIRYAARDTHIVPKVIAGISKPAAATLPPPTEITDKFLPFPPLND